MNTQHTTAQTTPLAETVHVFGIRHHGPGSTRSLRHAFAHLTPDIVLIEGPPDANDIIPLVAHADMHPPIALLLYVPDAPQHAIFYPFATFSPEYYALTYAVQHAIPVRFIDLPIAHMLALKEQTAKAVTTPDESTETDETVLTTHDNDTETEDDIDDDVDAEYVLAQTDPVRWLAELSGYSDSEHWWEHMVEQRRDATDMFTAILEVMQVLRDEVPPRKDPHEAQREASMRHQIRQAHREGYQRIAVVCGAWHAPALLPDAMPPMKHDTALLKGLPKTKIAATWVPWTYERLCMANGYGAGIESPGWYEHLWQHDDHVVVRWLTKVAHLLRTKDLDASSANIIEAVRLADTLAALRGRMMPGIPELNEAAQTVLCFGNSEPLTLIQRQLIIGDTIGSVPDATPTVPLQQDVRRQQKTVRLMPTATQEERTFDLRKANDLARSHLLHRLILLGIQWGKLHDVHGKKGTFHERWVMQWQPEMEIELIERSIWGTTLEAAAAHFVRHCADEATDLAILTRLIDGALSANLPTTVEYLIACVQRMSALSHDVAHLMDALPPLARTMRYSDVRNTNRDAVVQVVASIITRICIGLPSACVSLNDDAAIAMHHQLLAANDAIHLINEPHHLAEWHTALHHVATMLSVHGILAGRACRILLDDSYYHSAEAERHMRRTFSVANNPTSAIAWIEGFLQGSGIILLHDDTLWQLLDTWVMSLGADQFTSVLPLLRRTFASFEKGERRNLGERVRGTYRHTHHMDEDHTINEQRAAQVLPVLYALFGMPNQ